MTPGFATPSGTASAQLDLLQLGEARNSMLGVQLDQVRNEKQIYTFFTDFLIGLRFGFWSNGRRSQGLSDRSQQRDAQNGRRHRRHQKSASPPRLRHSNESQTRSRLDRESASRRGDRTHSGGTKHGRQGNRTLPEERGRLAGSDSTSTALRGETRRRSSRSTNTAVGQTLDKGLFIGK